MRRTVSSGDPNEQVYGYSRAVQVGNQIHVSGTTAQPPFVDGCDTYVQAKNALDIIAAALAELDAGFDSVVRTITYVTDIGDVELVGRAHREAFGDVLPAATLVQVAALDHPARTVEIEVYAITAD